MQNEQTPDPRRAALSRDAALARLRRVTRASVVVTFGLGGAFAALAAGSTHTKKTAVAAPARQAATAAALVVAPAPPLVAVASAPSVAQSTQASAPASAPTSSYAPPVVASGGS